MFKKLLLLFFCFSIATSAFAVIETYDFDTDVQRDRYQHFIEVLRCPKCQNQNLAGSNSPIAEDLRRELARQIKAGNQDQEIVDFMVARYGDFVLYDPRFKKNTFVLWLAPLFLLMAGLIMVFFMAWRSRRIAVSPVANDANKDEKPAPSSLVSPSDEGSSRQTAWIVFVVALVFTAVGSWLLYRHLGAGEQLEITHATEQFYAEVNKAAEEKRAPDPATGRVLIKLLLPYLQKHQDDLNLVYILGSTYAQLSEFENALPWYKQYLMAVPTDERVLTEYVQLLYIAAHQQLTDRVLFVVDRALTLNPHNVEVLSLMAMHYHQTGEFAKAADYWQRMLATLPVDSEAYPAVQKALAEARHGMKTANHPLIKK